MNITFDEEHTYFFINPTSVFSLFPKKLIKKWVYIKCIIRYYKMGISVDIYYVYGFKWTFPPNIKESKKKKNNRLFAQS